MSGNIYTKVTLQGNVVDLTNINTNFTGIETALNTLVLGVTSAGCNTMQTNLDMNSNNINNLAAATTGSQAVNLTQLQGHAPIGINVPSQTGKAGKPLVTDGTVVDWTTVDADQLTYTSSLTGAIQRTVESIIAETVSVKDFGAVGDGATDDTTAIQNAVTQATGKTLVFPDGTYNISNHITLPSDTTIIGLGKVTLVWTAADPGTARRGILEATTKNDIHIEQINFQDGNIVDYFYGISVKNCARVTVLRSKGQNIGVFTSSSTDDIYANASTSTISYDIIVRDIYVEDTLLATPLLSRSTGVEFRYTDRFVAENVHSINTKAGVQFWGGDANPNTGDGAIGNERWARNGKIVNCTHTGGLVGQWGSMGEFIHISNCTAFNADDVGIDFEGSLNCTVNNCSVEDGHNGCYTTFFYSENIVFNGCTATVSNNSYPIYRSYNDSLNGEFQNTVSIIGMTTSTTAGSGFAKLDDNNGPVDALVISNCNFENTVIDFTTHGNSIHKQITNNVFYYDRAGDGTQDLVDVDTVNRGGSLVIHNNDFVSTVTQPANVTAIKATLGDFGDGATSVIENNTFHNITTDVEVIHDSANAGTVGMTLVKNNTFSGTGVTRTESGAGNGKMFLEGNKVASSNGSNFGNYPNAVPVSGRWDAGQIIQTDNSSLGEIKEYICTTTGSPGTWIAASRIAPDSIRVSSNDTSYGDLETKLLGGDGITASTQNDGANETRTLAVELEGSNALKFTSSRLDLDIGNLTQVGTLANDDWVLIEDLNDFSNQKKTTALAVAELGTNRIAYVKDVKAANTAGGGFTSGAWQTRDLNTLEGDTSFISNASNQFTLTQAGTYHIEAYAPAYDVDLHKIKLRNISDSTDDIIGSSEYAGISSADTSQTVSILKGVITIASSKTFEIQHRSSTTRATDGFGLASNFGVSEVYTVVKVTRVS